MKLDGKADCLLAWLPGWMNICMCDTTLGAAVNPGMASPDGILNQHK